MAPIVKPSGTPRRATGDLTVPGNLIVGDGNARLDWDSWYKSYSRMSGTFAANTGSTQSNEFGLNLQFNSPVTSSSASYERDGLIIEAGTNDPSTSSVTRDLVGIHSLGQINAGNLSGRAWGADIIGTIAPGADGFLAGEEIDMTNNGSDQGAMATPTTKTALGIVGIGGKPITAAIDLQGANAHRMIYTHWDAPGPAGWQLIDDEGAFQVLGTDGSLVIHGALGGFIHGAVNDAGGYWIHGNRVDLPVYNGGKPWDAGGAYLTVNGGTISLCNSMKQCKSWTAK
jgi:hypothetical protein